MQESAREQGAGCKLVNVRRLFDHVPVQVSLSYSLDHTGFSQGAEEKTPDAIVLTFTSALIRAAKAVFGVVQGGRTAAQKAEAKQLAALLRQRRALRQRLHGCSEGMDLALTLEVVRLSRQLRRMAPSTGRAKEEISGRGAGEGVEGFVVRRWKGCQASQLQRIRSKEASVWAPGVDPAYRVHASGQAEAAGQGRRMCCRDRNGGCACRRTEGRHTTTR